MSEFKRGQLCYLVGLTEHREFIGRVCEILSGPHIDDDGVEQYEIGASWIREAFDCETVLTKPTNLLPITPPNAPRPAKREAATN